MHPPDNQVGHNLEKEAGVHNVQANRSAMVVSDNVFRTCVALVHHWHLSSTLSFECH